LKYNGFKNKMSSRAYVRFSFKWSTIIKFWFYILIAILICENKKVVQLLAQHLFGVQVGAESATLCVEVMMRELNMTGHIFKN
jgi:uncharacterized integral membrane protein